MDFPSAPQEYFERLVTTQNPYATVLGCSDSRVPTELIFGAGIGDLFVIRVAGNLLSPEVAGTLQYAVVHLKTPLVVVLGHEGCGAVKAALANKFQGSVEPSRIQVLIDSLLPALSGIAPNMDLEEQMTQAVEANVRWTMARILQSDAGGARIAGGGLKLVGAIYEISTGHVRFLD